MTRPSISYSAPAGAIPKDRRLPAASPTSNSNLQLSCSAVAIGSPCEHCHHGKAIVSRLREFQVLAGSLTSTFLHFLFFPLVHPTALSQPAALSSSPSPATDKTRHAIMGSEADTLQNGSQEAAAPNPFNFQTQVISTAPVKSVRQPRIQGAASSFN